MSPLVTLAYQLGLLALTARTAWADCVSFGMDFQDKGSYFQNSLSTDPFTFVTQFEGCQPDVCYNVFVDPTGDQYLCSDTQLTPDDTDQLSTCPIDKNQLYSGNWSVIVFSNDGDGDPIAYERDFSLSVGPQSTVTYTPTVTASVVTTPIVNVTTTTTETSTSVLPPSTITSPSTTVKPTVTITPSRVTTTKTITLLTLKLTSYTLSIAKATKTQTASCRTPKKANHPDPTAHIKPTVKSAAATITGAKFRRGPGPRPTLDFDRNAFLAARNERLSNAKLEERAPDPQPLTITDTNTADWITSTQTSTAPAVTLTQTTQTVVVTTSTPPPVTVLSGQTTQVVTVTAPTPTKTVTRFTVGVSKTTKTIATTVTITTKTTPSALVTSCRKAGGIIV